MSTTGKQLHQLGMNKVASLSKEEILAFNRFDNAIMNANMKKFGMYVHHMELLLAINCQVALFLLYTQPVHKKIMQRYQNLNKKVNSMEAEKKKKQVPTLMRSSPTTRNSSTTTTR